MTLLKPEIIALGVAIVAVLFNGCGLFLSKWWIDEQGKEYGVFTVVQCNNDVCKLALEHTEGWVIFGQVSAMVEFALLLASILALTLHLVRKNEYIVFFAAVGLCVSCLFSALHIFVLSTYYRYVTLAAPRLISRPQNHVLYQTLPIGLNAIAGTLCVPAFIALILWKTKEVRKMESEREATKILTKDSAV